MAESRHTREVEVALAVTAAPGELRLEPDPPTLHPDAPLGQVLAVVEAARDERTGLAFVPAMTRQLTRTMPLAAARDVLRAAAPRESIELRPKRGLGRLSAEELALCPPGPADTRMPWARRAPRVEA